MMKRIASLLSAPVFPDDLEKTNQAGQFHVILLFTFFGTIAFTLIRPILEPELTHRVIFALPAYPLMITMHLLNKRGYVHPASLIWVFGIWLLLFFTAFFSGGVRAPAVSGFIIVVLVSAILVGRNTAIFISLLSFLGGLVLVYLERAGSIQPAEQLTSPVGSLIAQGIYYFIAIGLLHLATQSIAKALGQARDEIHARKQTEIEREKLIADLEAQNAELERFTYTVSHDLKSPLVTISNYLGYLEKDLVAGNLSRLKQDNQRINNAVKKVQDLLADLLELSRIGRLAHAPEFIPFERVVNEALDLVDGQIKQRDVEVKILNGLPVIYGDHARLVEVVQNLNDNACKYMGDQTSPKIEIGSKTENGETILFIRDNGIGIKPEYHERVFGLFNKLDPSVDGTGVGLTLVKRIMEFHGGKIWIESHGQATGTAFCFTLGERPALP